jgi:hypothetical protein
MNELKEKLRKKSEKLKLQNKKIENLTKQLIECQQEKRKYKSLYAALINALPSKYYKLTYRVKEFPWFYPEPVKENKSIEAKHFKEAIVKLRLENIDSHVEIIDIEERAS